MEKNSMKKTESPHKTVRDSGVTKNKMTRTVPPPPPPKKRP